MSGSFGSPKNVTTYSGIPVQTTDATSAVPIVYGQARISATVIWYANFKQVAAGAKGGGKGGLFGAGAQDTYKADVIMAICQGLVMTIPAVWQTSSTVLTLDEVDLNFFEGSYPQAAWSVTGQTVGYTGICYVYAQQWDLGPAASTGNNSFEVCGILCSTGFNHGSGSNDADPAQVIQDFLTNTYYGVGFPSGSINTSTLTGVSGDSSLQSYCWATGLAFSPVLNAPEAANTTIDRWLKLLNVTAFWSGGMLSFCPYLTEPITGTGRTFNPITTVRYVLTDDDYIDDAEGPVVASVSDPYGIDNAVILEICDANDNYNTTPVQTLDQVAIQKFGLRVGSSIQAHEFTSQSVAQTSAQLILQRGLYVRSTLRFKLGWEFLLLDPMDIVEINDPLIGLTNFPVRITAIEEDDAGILAITAEEMPFGVAFPAAYPVQPNLASGPNSTATPNAVNAPIIFKPPPSLLTGGGINQVWIAVSPMSGDPNWGSCRVNISLDGASYSYYGSITGQSVMGVLSAPLATYAGSNPDAGDTISVDLTESFGDLPATFSSALASVGVSACLIGAEYISYEMASTSVSNKYTLSTLFRGLFGSTIAAASTNAPFVYLGGPIGKFNIIGAISGQTVYFKFQSVNIFGAGVQTLASCMRYTFTFP